MKTRTIIGLEIHVQLKTSTKMFCACRVAFEAPPNSLVCPVCLGHPGALPVINRRAFELSVVAALAINCKMAPLTKWDRKSYFYPDMPKNYQVSQYDLPLATKGHFEVTLAGEAHPVRIRRAHLEEDAGKNIHDTESGTLVDLNRAGTPLLEIVTEPDLVSSAHAYAFCTELHRLMTYLGVTEGNMKKGQMRFEPNINVAIEVDGKEYRTPIAEIKNLNSLRAVRDAISFESQRQIAAWTDNHDYVLGTKPNENRGWNADRGVTEYQREKEAAHDYRYFPDPDLVPIRVTPEALEGYRSRLPELPQTRRLRLQADYGLTADAANTIVADRATADLFDEMIAAGAPPVVAAKQFVNTWQALAKDRDRTIAELGVSAERMAKLALLVESGGVNKTAANRLAEVMMTRKDDPDSLAAELGLILERDTGATEAWVNEALAANEKAVRDAMEHPKKAKAAVGFLRGQVMKLSGGKADPKLVGELLTRRLTDLAD